jgi:hypothetical protein
MGAREIDVLVSDAPEVDSKHLGVVLRGEDEKRMDSKGNQSGHCDGQEMEAHTEEERGDERAFEDRELPFGPSEEDRPGKGGIDPVAH